ncbi:MAG TPA: outer membrane protein assembly factor [Aquifex aeolicus]|nr:outer membrane protein assembly factor [Aquifex aeolicus]
MAWTLLFLLLLISLPSAKVLIESNYPLRNNNFREKATEDNLFLILWALQRLKDVRNVKVMNVGGDILIYVERYPILREVRVRGNRFLGDEEIKNALLLREGEPLIDFSPESAGETLRLFYRRRGFLDAKVKVNLRVDEKGFAYIGVEVEEGDIYFLGGARFEGATSFPVSRLMGAVSLQVGDIYDEEKVKEGRFLLWDFYRGEGFLESFVYWEGTEKRERRSPFPSVLFPGKRTSAILKGLSNLLTYPVGVLKALFGRGFVALPIYRVIEGRRYEIAFEGNEKVADEELRASIDIHTPGVDIFFLENTKSKIEEYYRSRGFFDVKVSYVFYEGRVILRVEEGDRYKLVPLGFKGLDLPPFYDREEIKKAVGEFLEEVKERGYKLARLEILEDIDRQEKKVFLAIRYYRGKRLILKDIRFVGKDGYVRKLFSRYRALLPRILEEDFLEELHGEIRGYLREEGYLDGDFSVSVGVSEDEENMYFTYTYDLEKGERYRYGELLIYGNEKTRLREIHYTVVRQRYFSVSAEEESLWNLIQSESFTGVRIENLVDRDRKVVHRLVEVREDRRGVLEFAVGYNTEEELKVEGGVKLKNLFGVGIVGRLWVSFSEKYETYEVGFSDRFLFSRKYFADVSLFRRLEFHRSFDLESSGFALSLGYRPLRWTNLSFFLSRTQNTVSGTDAGEYGLLRYGLYLLREKRDDPINPHNLTHNSLRLMRAQGDREYHKVELNNFFLREIVKGLSLSWRFALGWVGKGAPVFDRFFLGGLRDMRGYDFEAIGYPQGGRTYFLGRAEIIFSVKEPVRASLYTDAGSVGKGFKYDIGAAIGLNTPAGFIRLDVAKPLSELPDPVSRVKVYLSIGYVY